MLGSLSYLHITQRNTTTEMLLLRLVNERAHGGDAQVIRRSTGKRIIAVQFGACGLMPVIFPVLKCWCASIFFQCFFFISKVPVMFTLTTDIAVNVTTRSCSLENLQISYHLIFTNSDKNVTWRSFLSPGSNRAGAWVSWMLLWLVWIRMWDWWCSEGPAGSILEKLR